MAGELKKASRHFFAQKWRNEAVRLRSYERLFVKFYLRKSREIYAKELPEGKKHKLAEAPLDVKGMFFHEGTLRLFGTHLEYATAEVNIAE